MFRNASSLPMMSAAVPQASAGPGRMQVTLMVPHLLAEGASLSLKFVGTAAGFRPVIVADADDNVLYVQARVLPDLVVASCQRRGSPVKTAAEPERGSGRTGESRRRPEQNRRRGPAGELRGPTPRGAAAEAAEPERKPRAAPQP